MNGTQGGGIKRMFQAQRRRFLPLPDYDLSQPERVDGRYPKLLVAGSVAAVAGQKAQHVRNLLRQLADTGRIQNVGGRRWPKWVLGTQ